MTYTREDNVIPNHFNIRFPLVLKSEESFSITFNLEGDDQLEFNQGVHYLFGDNVRMIMGGLRTIAAVFGAAAGFHGYKF